jgi:hypothetical protein
LAIVSVPFTWKIQAVKRDGAKCVGRMERCKLTVCGTPKKGDRTVNGDPGGPTVESRR